MMIDSTIQKRLREKYNPEGSTLRRAQCRMLEMLCFIDRVCEESNIPYWLDGGTLLGAVRHEGFIPWDDDTDICILEKDQKKLKEILFERTKGTRYILQCKETDKGYYGSWYVLRDLDSEYIVNDSIHELREYKGCQVDLFCVSDRISRPLQRLSMFLHGSLIVRPLYKHQSQKRLDRKYKFLYKYIFPLFKIIDSFSHPKYYRYIYGTTFFDAHIVKNIFPLKRLSFEGHFLNVPNQYEDYLKESYGDWNKLPKENELRIHSANIIFK